ncbi:adenovirus e3 region protein CR2 domain-containing protein [Pochonia chlamydosporia 170]|uniref:Adenovirus e3 region protein CR2 domain-containing protein n=1 Tax=Pochonia chlamydosporia 170 TaxID=1380566 RepID=A0A179FEX5_METCM|nr:adenovirus e3 region protein CR2 domain-containing protein [Pochonia chlamydosporia 170]OAQ64066.1 adenovirus e3 region protein CR2 domain-containing protein [Pochonia chlamydosporia 170]
MRSIHIAAALLASTATALPQNECFKLHSQQLAEYTDCGDRQIVSQCLSSLSTFEQSDLESCYTTAGCSAAQAATDVKYISDRCAEYLRAGELRKRFRAAMVAATTTVEGVPLMARATTTAAPTKKGKDCFDVKEFDTTSCDVVTENGKTKTNTCTPSKGTSSDCLSGWICTVDGGHQDICMKEQSIDTGGIIIAIVFAAFIVIGLAYLTFACCRERSHHKKVAAKAEAVALARAATKKQRAQEARAPLMQQTQDASGPNPFQDQPGHA